MLFDSVSVLPFLFFAREGAAELFRQMLDVVSYPCVLSFLVIHFRVFDLKVDYVVYETAVHIDGDVICGFVMAVSVAF